MKPEQKKIVKYVQSGSLLKLKTFLEKLNTGRKKKYNLNFEVGDVRRTPLHIACLLGDDAIVRCLLAGGASSDVRDRNKDTPAHIAAQFICDEGNYPDYKLLIEPLIRKHPETMSCKNKSGETPSQIINQAKKKYNLLKRIEDEDLKAEMEKEEEKEDWNAKLAREADAEFAEQLSDPFSTSSKEDDYQTYDEWADRIYAEYQRKHINTLNRKRRKEFKSRKRNEDFNDISAHLLKNEDEYVHLAKRMKEEVMTQKRERYEKKMASMRTKDADNLRFRDIPWPCQGNAREMVEVLLSGLPPETSKSDRKRAIVRQLVLWHPDKFEQRCGDRLVEKDKSRILETVKAIAQELNKNLESLKEESGRFL